MDRYEEEHRVAADTHCVLFVFLIKYSPSLDGLPAHLGGMMGTHKLTRRK